MKPEDLQRKNIYRVPENYFDKLPGKIMARVTESPVKQHQYIFSGSWNIYLKGALASVVLVVAFIFLFLFKQQPAAESHELLASISNKEAIEYLSEMEKLESQDLSLLSQSEQDLSHEFIQASQEDILEEVGQVDLEEHVY